MEDAVRRLAEAWPSDPEEHARIVDLVIRNVIAPSHLGAFWGDRLLTLDKTAGFLSDPEFKAALEAIAGSHTYDLYGGPGGIAWRLHTLVWAARIALALDGDFVECGVFKGDMSWVVSTVVDFKTASKTFFLFDTFAGIPERYYRPEDFSHFPEGFDFRTFSNQYYEEEGLYESVCERFEAWPNIRVIRGEVPDVLANESPDAISYLHVDLNSAAAEVGALETLFDRVVLGGVVILDDYGWKHYDAQKRAEDEFFEARGYSVLELPTGQGLVVKR